MTTTDRNLSKLLAEIRACRICEAHLPHGVRPVIRASAKARICIIAQAPGIRVHETGLSFNDPSGDRLRDWMGIGRDVFYDEHKIAIIGMAHCFPGYDANGGDLPPRKECAEAWQDKLFAVLPPFDLTLLIGTYAFNWHLKGRAKKTVSDTVKSWREYTPDRIPLPHPSWRNNAWLKKNPWFAEDLLPYLRRRVKQALKPR
ncbi:uracil-DNA glycosylase family protein [Rhizomicrobium electricum]|uniref:Uracil-DNA glycosylase family protein n=1 Tax=Rhizomicrobium electricum TaxID=480070 RepID=A0ABN1EKQ9_9PROT|nr:uracil-DNA glycosylase family protein [Rhizomicrobium electricum]NIJ47104.1 uracil-DNA glycosylase [Rhizomicrobium electricum]